MTAPAPIPGPELDLYLVKEVLGWSWFSAGYYASVADGVESGWYTADHKFKGSKFEPSRSFPNAWLMATILIQRGHALTLMSASKAGEPPWLARFSPSLSPVYGPSPEIAICVAALGLKP